MTIYKDEIFGPVLSVVRVNTYEEALEQHYKKVDERYEDKLRELRKRIKELEARLNIRKTESFFYNVLKERDKYD